MITNIAVTQTTPFDTLIQMAGGHVVVVLLDSRCPTTRPSRRAREVKDAAAQRAR